MTEKNQHLTEDDMPLSHKTGVWHGGHVQGIAVDPVKRQIFYSFTTDFCKYDFDGNLIGSVTGFTGHIGCMCLDRKTGKVYASLEYKTDSIGQGISRSLGTGLSRDDGFYIVIFDTDKIDRIGMNAEKDGAVRAVYLKDVVDDYHSEGKEGHHKYGCSGIDGVTFMPLPTSVDKEYLAVAYGIYGDIERNDNDNQVILFYDTSDWDRFAEPLLQSAPHRSGPPSYDHKAFLFTGNTTYGIQNLEYDPYTKDTFVFVYPGKKPGFENYAMFVIDGSVPASYGPVAGLDEDGLRLTLKPELSSHFPLGSTGIASLCDGRFYISTPIDSGRDHSAVVDLYVFNNKTGFTRII